jgi:hypothetical protein
MNEQQSKWSIGEYVYSPASNVGGMFVEDNGDGTCAVSTGAVVMAVPTVGLLNEKEYTEYREERRRSSLTWDELKQ